MKITKYDFLIERNILIGLIISNEFAKSIRPIIKLKYFQNKASREIATWCLNYFDKYDTVPKSDIQQIYVNSVNKLDEDVVDYLTELLNSLSEEYDMDDENSYNAKFYLDEALKYFKKRQLKELTDKLEIAIENDDVLKAEDLITDYTPIEAQKDESFDPFASDSLIEESFNSMGEALFKLPGKIGRMLNYQFYRASFLAFQGPEKVGKSWFLQEIMIWALKSKRRVAFFEAGDLTKEQRVCRLFSRLAGKPWIPGKNEGMVKIRVPDLDDYDEDVAPKRFEFIEEEYEVLTTSDAKKAREKWLRRVGNRCRMSIHSNGTLSPKMIDDILSEWHKKYNFVPDVIIIDYADILAPDRHTGSERDEINQIWKALRSLSQKWNACLITATQSDAKAYEKGTQNLTNFSEDKRKYSHVTAMFALNRTHKERHNDILRVSPLLFREGTPSTGDLQVALISHKGRVKPWYKQFYTRRVLM